MVRVDQLAVQRSSVREALELVARHQQVVELMLQLGAWVLPCAGVLFVVKGRKGGERVRLQKRAQATTRCIDMRKPKRADSACTLVVVAAIETAAADAGVGVGTNDHHVALVSTSNGGAQRVAVSIPLLLGGR